MPMGGALLFLGKLIVEILASEDPFLGNFFLSPSPVSDSQESNKEQH